MSNYVITPEEFTKILSVICSRDTSVDPLSWSETNPLWGHCAVVALLAQDLFGGVLIRESLAEVEGLEHIRSHYLNFCADGIERDFTYMQFKAGLPNNLSREERERERILSYGDTQKRYEILKERFGEVTRNQK